MQPGGCQPQLHLLFGEAAHRAGVQRGAGRRQSGAGPATLSGGLVQTCARMFTWVLSTLQTLYPYK